MMELETCPSADDVFYETVVDVKPSQESISQEALSRVESNIVLGTVSLCSLNSSVIGPPTYRPTVEAEDENGEAAKDLDARIKEVKCKIETEMKERNASISSSSFPRPSSPSHLPARPTVTSSDDGVVEGEFVGDPLLPKKATRPNVLLDPASSRVVDVASLPWHQRYALNHPYFRTLPYLPPSNGFPLFPFPPPQHIAAIYRERVPRQRIQRFRCPLVRYIPGGFDDLNRQSDVGPVDFSSELMSYVRMRKEMLKMDLREKIRRRKEDLIAGKRDVKEGANRGPNRGDGGGVRPNSKYGSNRGGLSDGGGRERKCGDVGRYAECSSSGRYGEDSSASRYGDGSITSRYAATARSKTPRQLWQERMRNDGARNRSRSSSSSSSYSEDDDEESRQKWGPSKKKRPPTFKSPPQPPPLPKFIAAKREKAGEGKENEYAGRRTSLTPKSYRSKINSPDRAEARREVY